jgi:hypothetical protein
MLNNDIKELSNYMREKRTIYTAQINSLRKTEIFKLSEIDFRKFNTMLLKFNRLQRKQVMEDIITKNLVLKLKCAGFNTRDINAIARQFLTNWNLILQSNKSIDINELFDLAIQAFERKEIEIEKMNDTNDKHVKNKRRKFIGFSRLITAGGITTSDALAMCSIPEPHTYAFLASFWIAATLFFNGVDDFFAL